MATEIDVNLKTKMPEIIKTINIQDGEYNKLGEALNIKGKGIFIEYAVTVEVEEDEPVKH